MIAIKLRDMDVCPKCLSNNVYRDYFKVGIFTSYYDLTCRDCGWKKECKETD